MESEWREVKRRGVASTYSERPPVRQLNHPSHRFYPKPYHVKTDKRYGEADAWNRDSHPCMRHFRREDKNEVTTYFFNNIPEDCSVEFLKSKFGSVRKALDVFCPTKRDLKGKPFDFFRFEGVSDPEELLADLNQLWIGSYKIRVYKPRFNRASDVVWGGRTDKENDIPSANKMNVGISAGTRKAGVSFREALLGENEDRGENCGEDIFDEQLIFQPMVDEVEWLQDAFTGYLKTDFVWEEVKDEINCECAGRIKVTTLGSNMVLVQSFCEQSVDEVLKDFDEWRVFWFQWCRPWRNIDVNPQRIIWTRWLGVPLNAWNPRFFNLACSKFGLVLKLEEGTRYREKLDEARIQISTGLQSVDRVLNCRINGVAFKIRIEEVRYLDESPTNEDRMKGDSESEWSLSPVDAIIGISSEVEE
ncbi:uncharacterized protein LOC130998315 [Salvia miltiorrhiza]|uniref:uncharacterized protein LOC130998315 n=1 Tax=Salvia miltiorrhiza TaxID=226208 RepID=UPI0025AB7F26|nr:uncharacterized protein LOC130998315 [Salvia miltiorrhiza]